MTKESLKTRCEEIEKALLQLVNQHASLTGQLAEAKHWLEQLEKAETANEVVGEVV